MTSAMRPGQIKPNDFELAILERLARKEPSLRGAVGQLHVLSREFTGVGSYTNFACDDSSDDAPDKMVGLDELITMPGVPNGMGAVLHCKGDRPHFLEVFTYGGDTYGDDHWEGVYDGFAIEDRLTTGCSGRSAARPAGCTEALARPVEFLAVAIGELRKLIAPPQPADEEE